MQLSTFSLSFYSIITKLNLWIKNVKNEISTRLTKPLKGSAVIKEKIWRNIDYERWKKRRNRGKHRNEEIREKGKDGKWEESLQIRESVRVGGEVN